MPPLKAALEDDTLYDIPADKDVTGDVRAFRVERRGPYPRKTNL
ncbi:hypothetical protein NWF32_25340 [Pseudomonas qingdaonensis]|nr:hypothetical protein [Pseudomonas qingdaonensis]